MDELITKASNQAVSFAIRSGISLASGYAIKTVTKFVDKIPEKDKAHLTSKIHRVRLQIDIVTPSIELIKSVNASGFSSLASCNQLIDELTEQFKQFDESVDLWTGQLSKGDQRHVIHLVNARLDALIAAIDLAVPLLNLSIVSSGINLNRNLSEEISVNKLIEASSIINASDKGPIGPVFDLKFYSVFYNPSRLKYIEGEEESPITWKEEYARAKVQIRAGGVYKYELVITENFDDDRYHEGDESVKVVLVESISKMFFSRSGRLLKLDNNDSAVLILKLKDEYIAFGMYIESESDSDSEDEEGEESDKGDNDDDSSVSHSLSLLEYLLRLNILQQNEKKPLSSITDEKFMIYLNNEIPTHKVSSQALDMDSNTKRMENLKIN